LELFVRLFVASRAAERSSEGQARLSEIDDQALLLEQLHGLGVAAEGTVLVSFRRCQAGLGQKQGGLGVNVLLRHVPGSELGKPAGLVQTTLLQ
jgi:hypothetical protein